MESSRIVSAVAMAFALCSSSVAYSADIFNEPVTGIPDAVFTADPLFAIERMRFAIVARIVRQYRGELTEHDIDVDSFRSGLAALRADKLLAASLVDELEDVVAILAAPQAAGAASQRFVAIDATAPAERALSTSATAYVLREGERLAIVTASELMAHANARVVGYFEPVNQVFLSAPAAVGAVAKDGPGSGAGSWLGYAAGNNVASGSGSAVAAGRFNAATNSNSAIFAGQSNSAEGLSSLVIGGFDNHATAIDSLVASGAGNRATGARSVVMGGGYNLASGAWSFVGGGGRWSTCTGAAAACDEDNIASGDFTVVTGGQANRATETFSAVLSGNRNVASQPFSVIAGGTDNHVNGSGSVVGGGMQNEVTGATSAIAGGFNNAAFGESVYIGGGRTNQAYADHAVIGGGSNNSAMGGEAVVGGGFGNSASSYTSAVVGGQANSATGQGAFIGGGTVNQASGSKAVITGGYFNAASGMSAVVAGGENNAANGGHSAVVGGLLNRAEGGMSVVLGGTQNDAIADGSLAAGFRAKASYFGSFMWADRTNLDFKVQSNEFSGPGTGWTDATNTFNARATGGVWFVTAVDPVTGRPTAGAMLNAGSGSWASTSDRASKQDFVAVDPRIILAKVTRLPVATWSYRTEGGVRHIGPLAQDFHALFDVGADERTISVVDADGVAFAAIQALNQRLDEKDTEIAALMRQLAVIKAKLGLE